MPGRVGKPLDPNVVAFGERVRELRLKRRMSQEQLAHAAGLHRTIVGFIERAEREVGISTLWKLSAALDVDPVELVTF